MNRILLLIATFFNIGKMPLAPGTWASLVTMITFYFINPYLETFWAKIISLIIIFLIGIPAAGYAEKYFQKKDPGQCVIDEVAGQMVCLIFIPYSFSYYLAAFFIFRIFDVLKPFPIRLVEKFSHGFGIMADDIIAGLYTLVVLKLFIYLKPILF
jgi:phosphatidylglycerophosphatase A